MANMRACLRCRYITKDEKCPICGSETTDNYRGLIIILNPKESDIAKKIKVDIKGKYALTSK